MVSTKCPINGFRGYVFAFEHLGIYYPLSRHVKSYISNSFRFYLNIQRSLFVTFKPRFDKIGTGFVGRRYLATHIIHDFPTSQ